MNKELYVSTTPHETKVALVEDEQLAEVYFERENEYTLAGSIYKGRVTRVLPGMQSAFVDIGLERDAFLYVSDFLDLQDEEEDGEFTELKVDGAALARANGLILPEAQAVEAAEGGDARGELAAEGGAASGEEEREGGTQRYRGRRRRRGRRGGRERASAEPQNGASGVEEESAAGDQPGEGASASEGGARRRAPRGFEPRGLAAHGLAHSEDEERGQEEAGFEEAAEEWESEAEPQTGSAAAGEYPAVVLPGESISKYSRGEGESQPSPAVEESAAGGERGGGLERRGERGRRGRGDRGRQRGRGRERDRERTPREAEAAAPPENYSPIVLPGESISKYRGTAAPESVEEDAANGERQGEAEEPRTSASYSGASRPPSLTQRYSAETGEEADEVSESDESGREEEQSEKVKAEAAEPLPDLAQEEPPADAPASAPPSSEASPDVEVAAERSSWRERVAKIFSAAADQPAGAADSDELQQAEADEQQESAPSEAAGIEAPSPLPEKPAAEAAEGSEVAEVEEESEDASPYRGATGSFVIEGGDVEHEELDEDDAEMPALVEHRNRYEESDDEDASEDESNGAQFGTAVRESEEEEDLENEEYDFGEEEFEESEMIAGEAGEVSEEEESDEPLFATSRVRERRAPARSGRGGRTGRRGMPQRGGRMRSRQQSRALPLISELLKEGQEILVQIAKEPIGKKGARITSHIALPGRFMVYMPTVNHIGVSRKISSEEERHRLKRIVSSERENGHGGFIVRTAAANIREEELRADIRFLKHLWNEIRTRAEAGKSPALIYHDLNLVERILRDQVTSDFSQIWVDNESEYERVVRFASRFQSGLVRRIKLYTKATPLFEQFGISDEINKSLKAKVWLKSGGYLVINQTEALVAIDINTGKYVGKTSRLEDTIVKTNIDAVKEIVRQVRLRDLGGIIIIDFIDMDERKNRQKVMAALEEAMKADRAPSKILQFNDFGLVAVTRKRVKQSLERTLGTPCPYCDSTGFVKSVPTVCNEIYIEMRKIRRHVQGKEVILRVNPEVGKELKSNNGRWLQEMEELLGHPVLVKNDPLLHQERFDMNY